jgi:tyrosyl-tRNA synthetase
MNLLEDLQWRGLVHQCSDLEGLEKLLASQQVTLYCGFDPTSDSLHVGNLIPMVSLLRFKKAGHNPLALIGGATGLIGDPSGKAQEREILLEESVLNNSQGIGKQLATITQAKTVNNIDWTKNMSVIDFMRQVGKNFSVNAMLARDSVNTRLNGDGLSFTEFSYMLFQGNDFLQLAKQHGCSLQIGGSDQFGNMCSGLDLLRKNNLDGFALTFPLLVKADGTKFGKSEKGTVWLSADKTSPWDFFQFWLNTADSDVVKLLKLYTFLSHEEITKLEESTNSQPELRLAQKALAQEVTTLIHGEEVCRSIQEVSTFLFSGKNFELSSQSIELLKTIIPQSQKDVATLQDVKQVMVETELAGSMTKATQSIKENSVQILELNNEPIKVTESQKDFSLKKPFLIKKGKKYFAIVH